jgi:hypothetical protein
MNHPSAPQRPGTSANPRKCQVSECAGSVAIWLPTRPIRYSLLLALFNDTPDIVAICKPHYKMLHRADGITLGYRVRQGKLQAYVKDVHY